MYSEQASREAAATEAGSLEDFLRTCALRLTLRRPASGEMSRVHELLQRTNQLNATLRRSSAADLQEYFADPSRYHMTVALLRDKFGDYGLIGLAAAEKERDAWNILELACSCRAMGKGVEEALLQHVGEEAGREGVPVLPLDFRRTDRNGQLLTLLERAGFRPAGPESQEILPLSRTRGGPDVPTSFPDWLEIVH